MGHCDKFFSQLARVDFDWKAESRFNSKWGGCFSNVKMPYRRVAGSEEYTCRNVD